MFWFLDILEYNIKKNIKTDFIENYRNDWSVNITVDKADAMVCLVILVQTLMHACSKQL